MRSLSRLAGIAVLSAATLLAGCAGNGRFREGLRPVANPGAVVAAELAFARAAQEQGQWTAFRKFAAKDAVLFFSTGPVEAKKWLSGKSDPAKAVTWNPLAVWSSCDGSIAVSHIAFAYPDGGPSGEGYTVWQRRKQGDYRYLFDFGWAAGRQPVAPEMIDARVAECKAPPAAPANASDMYFSTDHSLAWTYSIDNGTRSFKVWTSGTSEPRLAVNVTVPPQGSN
ncbi:hypothetical protein [Tsuneonella mangrovi]|uniref:hypothetical protein n=1 Tax=Tsuneonella mangrovi TaxID=1982042 RepID=UPI0012373C71|nr:hypothetical protein [Tsuneonella mangrovi]